MLSGSLHISMVLKPHLPFMLDDQETCLISLMRQGEWVVHGIFEAVILQSSESVNGNACLVKLVLPQVISSQSTVFVVIRKHGMCCCSTCAPVETDSKFRTQRKKKSASI